MSPRYLAVIGGIVTVIGSFMPWVTSNTLLGTISKNGIDGDGRITLVLGLLMAIGGLERLKKPGRAWAVFLIGILVIGVAFYDALDIIEASLDFFNDFGDINIGAGIYVVMVGGFLGLSGIARNQLGPEAEPTKVCPQCAETIKAAAKICRYCDYQFPPSAI